MDMTHFVFNTNPMIQHVHVGDIASEDILCNAFA